MGFLGKYATYRWVTAGRGGGDSGGSGLVLIFALFAGIIGVLWAVSTLLSFVWSLIYGFVRPLLLVFPPVTIPLAVVLVGWPFTWLSPYSAEKTTAFLDGTGDTLSFAVSTVWAVTAINVMILTGHYEAFPEPNGIVGMILALVVAFLLLYGVYELFHFPYRSFKLLLHAPRGSVYVIALLSPMSATLITSAFNVPLNIPLPLPELLSSELAVTIGALIFLNITYLGGALAVLANQEVIRAQATATEQDNSHNNTHSNTTTTTESTSHPDSAPHKTD